MILAFASIVGILIPFALLVLCAGLFTGIKIDLLHSEISLRTIGSAGSVIVSNVLLVADDKGGKTFLGLEDEVGT